MRPFEQQVRERAYYIWEGEGRVFGRAEDHWLRAEAELRAGGVVAPREAVVASPAQVLKPKAGRTKTAAVKSAVDKAVAAETVKVRAKPATSKATSQRAKASRASSASSAALH
jgi:hypothetical protein